MRTPGPPPPPPADGEHKSQPGDVEEGEVVEINTTTTGDVQVVVPKSTQDAHSVSTCAICHQGISKYALKGGRGSSSQNSSR
ncbi:hypothetical protein AB205_0203650 [Aquarana catesbeiana]|uniref:Uncharacterized protein n=1 Tax=Aquarana catesbeiana TaxID=8400 RepID=A0A2G9S8G7_AQUCT|nr:hypothetical protein AB205_0203650 [Aquarana catesbeiana]